jgi:hypothetical protein
MVRKNTLARIKNNPRLSSFLFFILLLKNQIRKLLNARMEELGFANAEFAIMPQQTE